jgi:hypothetical protein
LNNILQLSKADDETERLWPRVGILETKDTTLNTEDIIIKIDDIIKQSLAKLNTAVFKRVRGTAKSYYLLRHACLFVLPSVALDNF